MSVGLKVGIIGGTGLDNPDLLEGRAEKIVTTPFGAPSDALITGKIKGVDCVLLARHGRKHTVYPSAVNFRANIHALKAVGCTHVIVTTACGSLQDNYHPSDMVLIDQFIDRTTKRAQTFFDRSSSDYSGVCHIPMATPFCKDTRKVIQSSLEELNYTFHPTGTMVTIEGPRFSSRAESLMFRSIGADLVNMTTVPEVVLAAEAGLCYAAVALVTDYDCWKESDHVSVEAVLSLMKDNSNRAIDLLLHVIPKLATKDWTGIIKAKQMEVQMSVLPH